MQKFINQVYMREAIKKSISILGVIGIFNFSKAYAGSLPCEQVLLRSLCVAGNQDHLGIISSVKRDPTGTYSPVQYIVQSGRLIYEAKTYYTLAKDLGDRSTYACIVSDIVLLSPEWHRTFDRDFNADGQLCFDAAVATANSAFNGIDRVNFENMQPDDMTKSRYRFESKGWLPSAGDAPIFTGELKFDKVDNRCMLTEFHFREDHG